MATISTVGTVSATSRNKELSTEKINEEFLSGITEDEAKGGKQALEDLGLEPTVKTKSLKSTSYEESEDDQQITPEYVYGKPENNDTSIVVSASPALGSDEEVWMSVSMILRDPKHKLRNSWWCPDGIGIGFTKADWAPMGEPTISATDDHTAKYTADDVADNALAGTVNIKNHNFGGVASESSLPDATAGLTGKFRLRDDGEPSTLWGSYTHTYSPTPGGAIESITGGYGGIDVELNMRAAKVWSIAEPADPEDDL